MSEEDYQKLLVALKEHAKIHMATPETALAYLVHLGTNNPDGTLTSEYGGEYTVCKVG